MQVRHVYDSFIPKMLGVEAITLYPCIFYSMKSPSGTLISHELVHVKQIRKYGWLRFYLSYLLEYLSYRVRGDSGNVAYNRISYEKEAYQLQEQE